MFPFVVHELGHALEVADEPPDSLFPRPRPVAAVEVRLTILEAHVVTHEIDGVGPEDECQVECPDAGVVPVVESLRE